METRYSKKTSSEYNSKYSKDDLHDLLDFDNYENDDNFDEYSNYIHNKDKLVEHLVYDYKDISLDFIISFFDKNKIKKIYILYYVFYTYLENDISNDGNILFYFINKCEINLQCTDKDSFDSLIISRLVKYLINHNCIFKILLLNGINLSTVIDNNVNVLFEYLQDNSDESIIELIFKNGYTIVYNDKITRDPNECIYITNQEMDILCKYNFDFTKTDFLYNRLCLQENYETNKLTIHMLRLLECGVNHNHTYDYLNLIIVICLGDLIIYKHLLTAFLNVLDYDISIIYNIFDSYNSDKYKEDESHIPYAIQLLYKNTDSYKNRPKSKKELEYDNCKSELLELIVNINKGNHYVLK